MERGEEVKLKQGSY